MTVWCSTLLPPMDFQGTKNLEILVKSPHFVFFVFFKKPLSFYLQYLFSQMSHLSVIASSILYL